VPIRDNKFIRQAQQLKAQKTKHRAGLTEELSIDDQLTRLDDDIRRLKIEFDIYFNGASKRPPYDTKNRVETVIKRIGDDRTLTYAQRYRYTSLASRYGAFREMWRRTIQGREEGRDAGAAARAAAREEVEAHVNEASFVCDDAHRDVQTVRNLYDALVEAKAKCGEPTSDLSFPRFHHLVASKTDNLKERLGCERVRFSVDVEGGRVTFKAKAEKEEGDPD
jgi:hypothetical protein